MYWFLKGTTIAQCQRSVNFAWAVGCAFYSKPAASKATKTRSKQKGRSKASRRQAGFLPVLAVPLPIPPFPAPLPIILPPPLPIPLPPLPPVPPLPLPFPLPSFFFLPSHALSMSSKAQDILATCKTRVNSLKNNGFADKQTIKDHTNLSGTSGIVSHVGLGALRSRWVASLPLGT